MSNNDEKPWERPWTTEEMIENASNWNLAGDSGLLKYLEEFSEKMLTKVKDTNDRLNDLIDSAEETSISLNNATNQFMGLRNTQFIESRVYEDDETLPTKSQDSEKEVKQKPTEAERLDEMKQAIMNGLEIIDKYYEKVEIPESDSEEDSGEPNVLYQSIDPYINRPLPYVIGTAEWHKYWHVGLGHSSSDSEVENEQEQFSESESEQDIKDLPERDRSQIPGISDSETDDFQKTKMSRPVANSTFNDQTTKNMFDSSSDSETGSLPAQINTVNSNFAEELAAKLGKVESANIEVEVNTKPIQKQTSNIAGGLFSDEPPPLDDDDDDDMFVNKNMNSGLFSGGGGLFDDVDDDNNDFWNTKSSVSNNNKKVVTTKTSNKADNLFPEESKEQQSIKKPSGLFDEDDDELFSTRTLPQPKKTILAPFKTTAPLVSEEPPELETSSIKNQEESKRKKPVGGISVLGPNVLLDSKIFKTRAPSSSESENDDSDFKAVATEAVGASGDSIKTEETKKLTSLFDDTSPLFSDDIFSASTTNKFSSKLFEPETPDDELFKASEEKKTNIEETVAHKTSNSIEPDLFIHEPPPLPESNSAKTLFNDTSNIFEDDLFSNSMPNSNKNKIPSSTVITTNKQSKSLNLFVDNDDDDDLFSSISNKKSHSLFESNPSNNSKNFNVFDPNPPELDESDNKSDSRSQVSLENETDNYGSMNAGRVNLFDTEPPLLSNESSGIVRDQSTSRVGGEDSSFFPGMTSTRRHSNMFQENQTGDSLFTAKSVADNSTSLANSDLIKIPEDDYSITKIDITPSGNESSLINDSSVFYSEDKQDVKPVIAKKPSPLNQEKNIFKSQTSDNPKNKNTSLFQDSDSDDDLFSNSSTKPIFKNKNIFEDDLFKKESNHQIGESKGTDIVDKSENNSKQDLFDNLIVQDEQKINIKAKNKTNDSKKFNYEENLKSDEDIKIDPKKSLNFGKNIETEKSPTSTSNENNESDQQSLNSGSSPGKLKHNLNINVAALLPGAAPPRKQNLEKSASLDSSESNQNAPSSIEETIKPIEKVPDVKGLEKSLSFESPLEHGEILPSAIKERVKIPVKRRPSTRRARQEAIRKSAIDLKFEDGIIENDSKIQLETQNILNIANNNLTADSEIEEKQKNIKNDYEENTSPILNPLSPSTDEEDFLTMPREKDLSDSFLDDSLFGKAPVISPVEVSSSNEVQKKISVENREDTDNLFDFLKISPKNSNLFSTDIFSSSSKDLFSDMAKEQIKKPTTDVASIFSSSDSENDLFSTLKSELKKPVNKTISDNKSSISSPDEDLFKPISSISVKVDTTSQSKILPKEDTNSLFEDEDIFSTKKIPPKPLVIKKSLFDDDDDNDDDIFGASTASLPKPNIPSSTTSITTMSSSTSVRKPAQSRLKKLPVDPVEDLFDPLDALKK